MGVDSNGKWVDAVVLVPTTRRNEELATRVRASTKRILDEITRKAVEEKLNEVLKDTKDRARNGAYCPVHDIRVEETLQCNCLPLEDNRTK